jgi:hypothetical protein
MVLAMVRTLRESSLLAHCWRQPDIKAERNLDVHYTRTSGEPGVGNTIVQLADTIHPV